MFTIGEIDTIPGIDPYHADTNTFTKTVLEIDPNKKKVTVFQDYDTNSTDFYVYHGKVKQVSVSSYPNSEMVRQFLMSEEGQSLLEEICEGYEEDWNGNNWVGKWNENVDNLLEDLSNELESYDEEVTFYTPEDFYESCWEEINGTTTDLELHLLEKEWLDSDKFVMVGDLFDYMQDFRNNLRDAMDE